MLHIHTRLLSKPVSPDCQYKPQKYVELLIIDNRLINFLAKNILLGKRGRFNEEALPQRAL